MPSRFLLLLVAMLLLVQSGCQRLRYETTIDLEPLELREITPTAPTYAQRVTVTVAPTNASVSGYLCKTSDLPQVKEALNKEKEPAASLLMGSRVSKERAETYTFEASVPAKTEYTILLRNGTKTNKVAVKVEGK